MIVNNYPITLIYWLHPPICYI